MNKIYLIIYKNISPPTFDTCFLPVIYFINYNSHGTRAMASKNLAKENHISLMFERIDKKFDKACKKTRINCGGVSSLYILFMFYTHKGYVQQRLHYYISNFWTQKFYAKWRHIRPIPPVNSSWLFWCSTIKYWLFIHWPSLLLDSMLCALF